MRGCEIEDKSPGSVGKHEVTFAETDAVREEELEPLRSLSGSLEALDG